MAFALGFSRDVTALINSYWDSRYHFVRGGGQTPSASAMPLPVPQHDLEFWLPISHNMEDGKKYIQRLKLINGESESTMINIWQACRDYREQGNMNCNLIRSFDCCTSDDVSPCDRVALSSTCDACENSELQNQRTHF